MENKDCINCIYKFANIKGWKFEPTTQEICEYYLPMMIHNQNLPCNHVILKKKMYEDYSTPWEIFKDNDPHWLLTASQETNSNKDETSNKIKKSVIYVFTNLKKNGKKNYFRKAGCGTWNQQNNKDVLNNEGDVIGSDKSFCFQVFEEDKEKIGDINNCGSWTMHEYSLKPTVCMPHLNEYAICKIRKEQGVDDEDDEASGSLDNNVADCNQLPVVQLEDHLLLNESMFGLPIERSVPHHPDYGAYINMLLQPTEGGSSIINPEPSLVVNPNHAQDPNQFSSQAVDIVSHQEDCGEWNVYANMLLQPAEGGGVSSNIVCDQPQLEDKLGSPYLMSTVNTSADLANVAAATTPNQLQQGDNYLPQSQSLRKRKNSEVTTVTKKGKKQRYLVFN